MKELILVSGNAGKLREWQRLMPPAIALSAVDEDLPEIQSLDLEAIVVDKARRAFEIVGKPVVVEDISVGLVKLNGLPGPFVKFFEKQMGKDALHQLANEPEAPAVVTCWIGYCAGKSEFAIKGEVNGTVVAPRNEGGFGFDGCFIPDGQTKTYVEMTPQEKDAVSHRAKAVASFVERIQELGL